MGENERKSTNSFKVLEERFLKFGLDGFLEKEVIDLLFVLVGEDEELSEALFEKYGGLLNIVEAPVEELASFPNMNLRTAALIKLASDFSEFYLNNKIIKKSLNICREDLIKYLRKTMGCLENEHFKVVFLDNQNNVIKIETLEEGTINQTFVHPRKVMEKALFYKAASLIFVHNHPTGKAKPSSADRDLTHRLVMAAAAIDLNVLDHFIINQDGFFSFKDSGLLDIARGSHHFNIL